MRVWRTWSKDLIKRDVKEKLIAGRKWRMDGFKGELRLRINP